MLIGVERLTTEFDVEAAVVAFSESTFQREIRAGIGQGINMAVDTGFEMPMAVDFGGRLQAVHEVAVMGFRLPAFAFVFGIGVGVFNLAVPFYHVGIALEVRNANAQSVELVGEFGGQTVDKSFIGGADSGFGRTAVVNNRGFRHGAGNHLSHFVTGDVALAAESAVAVTVDNVVGSELADSVIRPVVGRNIGERVRSSERGVCGTQNKSGG